MVQKIWFLAAVFSYLLCLFLVVPTVGAIDSVMADSLLIPPQRIDFGGPKPTTVIIDDNSASARDDSSRIVALENMVVSANRRQRLLETSQSISIIKPDQWEGTSKSLADVLSEQTGIQTRRYGGTGSFQTVSIRGVQGSEVLVLLDGIVLNSAMGGAVDLGGINTDRVGEIEVYKGITPSRFGGNCIGGVVNIKSKNTTKKESLDLKTSVGSYGYLKTSIGSSRSFNDRFRLYALLGYLQAANNYVYRSDNRTPYDKSDDTEEELINDDVKLVDFHLQPSVDLVHGSTVTSAISYSNMDKGHPAGRGHVNPSARVPKEQFSFTARLSPPEHVSSTFITLTPEISYSRLTNKTFWTGADKDMGTWHGDISLAPNSYAEYRSTEQTLQTVLVADMVQSDYLSGELTLGVKHADITTTARSSTSLPNGDLPGNAQECFFAADIDGMVPIRAVALGATIGGSAKAIRSATRGGKIKLLEIETDSKDTLEYSFAARGGVHLRARESFNVFLNLGHYSDIPKLRERYGTDGNVIPNPSLRNEKGTTCELGTRLSLGSFFAEAVLFYTGIVDGIVMLSDGTITRPVNLAKSRAFGLECVISAEVFSRFSTELRSTLQRTENLMYLYRYNKLPNEPDMTILGKCSYELLKGLKCSYWLDYKTAFWRDYANKHRMPDDQSISGIALHNAQVSWNVCKFLELDFSIRNIHGALLRADELSFYEAGYEWTLYPSNEWSVTASFAF